MRKPFYYAVICFWSAFSAYGQTFESESFESGTFNGWTAVDIPDPFYPINVNGSGIQPWGSFFSSTPSDGNYAVLHGFDGGGPGSILLYKDVLLDDLSKVMVFDYRGAWDLQNFGASNDRIFVVHIAPPGGGTPMQTDVILTANAGEIVNDTGTTRGTIDISQYAGSEVRIIFEWIVPEYLSGPAFFQLDNILVPLTILDFNQNIPSNLIDGNIIVHGDKTGSLSGSFIGGGTSMITFVPDSPLQPGEVINISATTGLGIPNSQNFQFVVGNDPSPQIPAFFEKHELSQTFFTESSVVKAADLNGNGNIDIVGVSNATGRGSASAIVALVNNGNGDFNSTITVGSIFSVDFQGRVTITDVAMGDFDGDGLLDLVSSHWDDFTFGSGELLWYRNNGNNTFSKQSIGSINGFDYGIEVIDMDGDGDMDIICAFTFGSTIKWYDNNGSGSFTQRDVFDIGQPSAVKAGDIDQDGDVDIVVTDRFFNGVSWLENNGSENFSEHVVSNNLSSPRSVFLADLDNDGDLDISSASFNDNKVSWFENNGDLTQEWDEVSISNIALGAEEIVVGDIDGDGFMDLLSASSSDDRIAWYENEGNGTFTEFEIDISLNGTNSLDRADIDGDGDLDVVGFSSADNQIVWYENTIKPLQLAQLAPISPKENRVNIGIDNPVNVIFNQEIAGSSIDQNSFKVSGESSGVLEGSYSGDGTSTISFEPDGFFNSGELITVTLTNDIRAVFGSTFEGETSFQFRTTTGSSPQDPTVYLRSDIITDTEADGVYDLHPADINGDGNIDILAALYNNNELVLLENDAEGGFTTTSISGDLTGIISVNAADMNNDGLMDILAGTVDKVVWFQNEGSGDFSSEKNIDNSGGIAAYSVYPVDMESDGDMDVISPLWELDILVWYRNNGSSFTRIEIPTLNPDGNPFDASAADVDADGDIDIIAAWYFGDDAQVAWYENDGSEGFTERSLADGNDINRTTAIYPIDLDSDGDLDILSASESSSSNEIFWYENDGMQSFTPIPLDLAAESPHDIFASDLEGDGDIDVVAIAFSGDKIIGYINDGSQSFTEKILSTGVNGGESIFVVDIDGDRDMDILSASFLGDQVSVLENVSSAKNFVSFTLNDQASDAVIDTPNKEISIVLKSGIAKNNLVPNFEVSQGALVSVNSVQQQSGQSVNNFTNPVMYTVTAEDGLSSDVWTITVLSLPNTPVLNNVMQFDQTTAMISWQSAVEAESYLLDLSSNGFLTFLTEGLPVSETFQTLTALDPAVEYQVRITAVNAQGNSPLSNEVSFITLPEIPELRDIDSEDISQTTVALKWSSVSGTITDYLLEISDTEFVDPVEEDDMYMEYEIPQADLTGFPLSLTETEIIVGLDQSTSQLSPGTTYWIRVSARNGNPIQSSGYSSVEIITTRSATPEFNEIAINDIGQTTTNLSWNTVVGATDYQIDVSDNGFQTFINGFGSRTIQESTIEVIELESGTNYEARVRSLNATGVSPNSLVVSFLTIPGTPLAGDATSITEAAFTANWSEEQGATSYMLEISADNFETVSAQYDLSDATPFKVDNLEYNTVYQYRVRALNSSGISPNSNIIGVKTSLPASGQPLSLSIDYDNQFDTTESDTQITIEVSGGSGIYSVTFRHRGILSEEWDGQSQLMSGANGNYSFTAIPEMFDELGLLFEVEVNDEITSESSSDNYIYNSFNQSSSKSLSIETFGGEITNWQLFSIPFKVEDDLIETIFDELGPFNYKTEWRLVHWKDGKYVDFGEGINRIELGKGYWFNAKDSVSIQIGAGQVNDEIPFDLVLTEGWNQIGNPYNVPISWNRVLEENGNPSGVGELQVISGSNQSVGNVMPPFSGGFVFSESLEVLEISPITSAPTGRYLTSSKAKISSSSLDSEAWVVPINLLTKNMGLERIGGVGMHPEAKLSKDRFDEMSLPRFVFYSDLHTKHEEYIYPYFATDVVPSKGTYSWSFSLASNKANGISNLTWDYQSLGDNQAQLVLLDKRSGQTIDMKSTGSHSVDLDGKVFEFEIFYSADANTPIGPQSAILGNAYPNPANTSTFIPLAVPASDEDVEVRLSIFDINGKQVKLLRNSPMAPGFHQIEWNLTNDQLSAVGRGLYIYRVEIEGQVLQKKLIVE